MFRDIEILSSKQYDLLIIGGGINGAFAALDAAQRGLSVILVDKQDFGAATSAASGKMIHGGIRFMQHGAFIRVYESLHERMVFQRIAPHLVHPVPFMIPTYGHGLRGKEILKVAMFLYDLLGIRKNNSKDPSKYIPRHIILTREEVIQKEPDIIQDGLTGAVLFYDCLMQHPERLTFSIIQSASQFGADVFNYMRVEDFLKNNGKIYGAKIRDLIRGREFEIQSKMTLNMTGPWSIKLLNLLNGKTQPKNLKMSKGIHIISHNLTHNYAIAIATHHKQAKALLNRGGRHFFIVPWRGHSIVGTTNVPFNGDPDDHLVSEKDIVDFLNEIRELYPPIKRLNKDNILFAYGGIYPDDLNISHQEGYQGHRKDQIINHRKANGISGIISVIGVKYTTARKLAQRTVDLVFKELGSKNPPICKTEYTPIVGGEIKFLNKFRDNAIKKYKSQFSSETIHDLITYYGSNYTRLFEYEEHWLEKIDKEQTVLKSQIIHAVREEMALKLSDVIFRRTGLGTVGHPGNETINSCANIMAQELRWDEQRIKDEILEIEKSFNY